MQNKINLLMAYPYIKPEIIPFIHKRQKDFRFLIDSGAFTAWKSGKPIQLDDYCRFIEGLPFEPFKYFTLDVIGDPEASFKNYQIMLDRGFTPIPIFTRGEDLSMVDEYYKTSDVLGIGGLVGTRKNKGFVKGIMQKIGKRKVHWLGFTNKTFISYYKPYMCDCSSWSYVMRWGYMLVYDMKGGFKTIYRKDFKKKLSKEIFDLISNLGVDPNDLRDDRAWEKEGSLAGMVGARGYYLKTLQCEKMFNTKMFLACATLGQLEMLLKARSGVYE